MRRELEPSHDALREPSNFSELSALEGDLSGLVLTKKPRWAKHSSFGIVADLVLIAV